MDRYSRGVTVKLDFCADGSPAVTKCGVCGIKDSGVSIDHQSLVGVTVIGEVGTSIHHNGKVRFAWNLSHDVFRPDEFTYFG